MEYVRVNAQNKVPKNGKKISLDQTTFDDISGKLRQALENIKEFKNKPFLLS